MNVLENLTGAALLTGTSEFEKVEMKNGLATLKNISVHVSKKGHFCAKVEFQDSSDVENKSAGHVEFLSTGEGNRFVKVLQKLVYIAKHSTNDAAKQAFSALNITMEVVKDAAGNPLKFKTMDELKQIQDSYGEDVTFVWNENEAKDRTAVRINEPEALVQNIVNVLTMFKGEEFFLEVKEDSERGFQRLVSINAPKL
jgi:hypothetical protein